MNNVWSEFKSSIYTIEDLGRTAVFLIPASKLKDRGHNPPTSIEEVLHQFLTENFGAYHTTLAREAGFWKNGMGQMIYDESVRYEVAFLGKERLPLLLEKIAAIAKIIQEDCIYITVGQYTGLVRLT